jgi:hypothetical protein
LCLSLSLFTCLCSRVLQAQMDHQDHQENVA